ncbi:hypothetical protein [Paraburkholderia sp. FT54]
MTAAEACKPQIVKLLLYSGADHTTRNQFGLSAAYMGGGCKEVAALLR